MKFSWDIRKSANNQNMGRPNFNYAVKSWDDEFSKDLELDFEDENRYAKISNIDGKIWVVIYTLRDEGIRIISFRRASLKYRRYYYE